MEAKAIRFTEGHILTIGSQLFIVTRGGSAEEARFKRPNKAQMANHQQLKRLNEYLRIRWAKKVKWTR